MIGGHVGDGIGGSVNSNNEKDGDLFVLRNESRRKVRAGTGRVSVISLCWYGIRVGLSSICLFDHSPVLEMGIGFRCDVCGTL